MRKNYILGSGLVGLLVGYYKQDYNIIGDNAGGQFNSKFVLGPRYIHKTEATVKLLDDLKIDYNIKEINVGYFYNGQINKQMTPELKMQYYKKSRLQYSMREYELPEGVLSSGKNKFEILDFDINKLINKMPSIIQDRIVKIDTNKRELIGLKNKYLYNKLIVTIPLPTFHKLLGYTLIYVPSNPITYTLVNSSAIDLEGNDYVYYVDDSIQYNRITKINDTTFVVEYPGMKDKFDKIRSDVVIKQVKFQRYGHVLGKSYTNTFRNITFVGRYAEWSHSRRIHNIVKDLQNGKVEFTTKNVGYPKKTQ